MTGPADGRPHQGGGAISVVIPAVEQRVALSPERSPELSPELVDLITEAVAMPDTATARAEVVGAMLLRALDAVSWRQGLLGDGHEKTSLLQVVRAAEAHRRRMMLGLDRLH
jgi:hypothetical protein